MSKIRLSAPLQTDSIVDGDGLRFVLWTQGCLHNCLGCHNPNTHDLEGGYLEDIAEICRQMDQIDYHDGISISGGEPFLQAKELLPIVKHAKNNGMNVWVYTGFTIEELLTMEQAEIRELLEEIDILVDGRFVQALFSYDLLHRGSSNQRVINVKEYLKDNK